MTTALKQKSVMLVGAWENEKGTIWFSFLQPSLDCTLAPMQIKTKDQVYDSMYLLCEDADGLFLEVDGIPKVVYRIRHLSERILTVEYRNQQESLFRQ